MTVLGGGPRARLFLTALTLALAVAFVIPSHASAQILYGSIVGQVTVCRSRLAYISKTAS